jgi:hypothetical protein
MAFPKIHELHTADLAILNSCLLYKSKPVRCQTGIVLCPYGVSEEGKLKFSVSDAGTKVLRHIDTMVEQYAESRGMEYISVFSSDMMNIKIGPWTRFFDSNKVLLSNDNSVLTTEFTASILLEMTNISEFNEKLILSVKLMQVMVRTYNQFPRGCVIFNNIDDLREALTADASAQCVEGSGHAGQNFKDDDSTNELLD